ncbi:succinylglutamate desuccinylase/aspartoacylase family protein [Craterilacuibacter sp.]|uniref:succinylglutamate desuccinylase/aspartoacylase family protein n=1 Tax=Craterilacuibacter sp. TaxID=2870909 RepID=UPI003F39406A
MHIETLPLISPIPGQQHALKLWRFGNAGARPRVYLQAALHADEIPGMLTLTLLREQLAQMEAGGRICGEILLLPVANPVGLAQQHLGLAQGRFDAGSGLNFNRNYPDLGPALLARLQGRLGQGEAADTATVRTQMQALLDETRPKTELESLQHTLFALACSSDVVLDLHCDSEAELHLYVHSEQQDEATALAGFMGAAATLHATEQGGHSFDDCCTRPWWWLRQHYPQLPMACFAATLELRGQLDVSLEQAADDAKRLLDYLVWRGAVTGEAHPPAAPAMPTPLQGVGISHAPHGGIVSYCHPVGGQIEAGTRLGWVIDPLTSQQSELIAEASGIYYARVLQRFAVAGTELCFIAGQAPLRSGRLLAL